MHGPPIVRHSRTPPGSASWLSCGCCSRPCWNRQQAGQEIAALLTEALTDRAPKTLTLRAHPDTLRAVAEPDPTRGHAAQTTMQPDATLPFGTAEIAWVGGGLTLDPAALHARVVTILAPNEKEPAT